MSVIFASEGTYELWPNHLGKYLFQYIAIFFSSEHGLASWFGEMIIKIYKAVILYQVNQYCGATSLHALRLRYIMYFKSSILLLTRVCGKYAASDFCQTDSGL